MTGIVTASILMGALVGSMIGGPIADKLGRRVGIAALAIITLIGAPALAASPSIPVVIVTRTFLGVGVGMSGVICPMYVSETAPPELKGPLGIMFQLAITVGIFLAYVANYALKSVEYNWRLMFGLGAVPSLVLLAMTFIIPESPAWLLKGERAPLIPTNERETPYHGSKELARPPAPAGSTEAALGVRLRLFLKSKALRIGIVLAIAQQLTGINAFMFYANSIFDSAGISNTNVATIGLGFWNAVTTVIAIPLVDRLGRRPLLIIGTAIMSIACFALGLAYQEASQRVLGPLAIVFLLIFVAAFEVGDGPLFWIVAHELFTPEIKTVGASTLNAVQWVFNITLTLGFPIAQAHIHETVFYIFGSLGIFCTAIMLIALPETRSKNNEDRS